MQDMSVKFENLLRTQSQCVVAREVFPGPLCSWRKKDEKTHCLNQIPHLRLYPFISIIQNTRQFFLIRTGGFENGIRFFFEHCHVTYLPTCPLKGKLTIKGKYWRASYMFREFTLYLKNFKFDPPGWGRSFNQNIGVVDYNLSRSIFEERWYRPNW